MTRALDVYLYDKLAGGLESDVFDDIVTIIEARARNLGQ